MADPLYDFVVSLGLDPADLAQLQQGFAGVKAHLADLDVISKSFSVQARKDFAETTARLYALGISGQISWKQYGEAAALNIRLGLDQTKRQEEENKRLEETQKRVAEAAKLTKERYQAVSGVFQQSTGFVMGWVRAGLSMSAEGERLNLQMQRLAFQIGGVFAPAIRGVIDGVTRAAAWFQQLSGQAQHVISSFVLTGAAALGVAVYLPKLAAGFQMVGSALTFIVANPFIALVAGLAAVMVGTEEGQAAFSALWDAIKPVVEAVAEVFQPLAGFIKEAASALAGVLGPAFKAIGDILRVTLVPLLQAVAYVMRQIFGSHTTTFETPRGAEQLRNLQPGDRAEEARRRQEEIDYLRERASLFEIGQVRERTGMGTGWARAETETQRQAIVAQMQRDLDEQRRAAGRSRQNLTPRGGGQEDVRAIFGRLQAASNRADPMVQRQDRTNEWLDQIHRAITGGFAGARREPGNQPAVGQ